MLAAMVAALVDGRRLLWAGSGTSKDSIVGTAVPVAFAESVAMLAIVINTARD